ncbi:MAG: hypothetical protein WBB85_20830 [Albidovulum sp.]|uniref:hypothetical protein n=1 Tax=Albidovulum sp. TaxID=1872424 RepID=UPI003C9C0318
MSSNVKWSGLLPEIETAEGLVPLVELRRPKQAKRCEEVFGSACRYIRGIGTGIRVTASLIERFLTTFAVLEVLGIVLLIVFLQL